VSDDTFEQLLARSARRQTPPPGSCPDASELAAFLDGALESAERRQVERHVAACARCALHVATISRLEEAAGEHVDGPAPAWWRQWQWAVPIVTVVLAVAVWVAVPGDIADSGRRAPASAPQQAQQTAPEPARATAEPPEGESGDAPPAAAGAVGRAESSATGNPAPQAPAREKKADLAKETPAAPAPQPFRDEAVLQRREPETDAGRDTRFETAPQKPASTAEATEERMPREAAPVAPFGSVADDAAARPAAGAAAASRSSAATLIVTSPDAAVRWRVQQDRIERTTDAGRTWQPDHHASVPALRAGAAPAADVCWLAGARGLVLRRDPSGEWTPVPLPLPLEVHAVTSSSAREAIVTSGDGLRLQTVDGGRTWRSLQF
jgi:hypothetical protein